MAQPKPLGVGGPLFAALSRLSQSEGRFHVPGHKGNPAALPFMGGAVQYDLTEIPGADDLQHPSGAIAESEALMSRAYGSGATLYSAAGSSSCIQAMLTLFCPPGSRVVLARNCHVSAVRALAFLDLQPIWVQTQNGRPRPADIAAALKSSGAKCVYITSPDYYGRIAGIEAIAAACAGHGAKLLVDNAHGAHLPFLQPNLHPLHRGADACCDSAHKTLPCLTPAALLHLKDTSLAGAARRALNLYSSTSPSYPVLASLDSAAAQLAVAPPDFAAAAAKLQAAAAEAPHPVQPGDDPLKLCLHPAAAGLPYSVVRAALAQHNITPELEDGQCIVLMASPYNSEADFAALAAALKSLPAGAAPKGNPVPEPSFALPAAATTVRQAVFAQKQRLPVNAAVGRVAAELAAPCPPGIPVLIPGERVTNEAAALLLEGGISSLDVVE